MPMPVRYLLTIPLTVLLVACGGGAPATSSSQEGAAQPVGNSVNSAAAPAVPATETVSVPADTVLRLELTSALGSDTSKAGAPVSARVTEAVRVNDKVVIPVGTVAKGEVIDAERSGRVKGRARLSFRITALTLGGASHPVDTRPIALEAEAGTRSDATKIGGGAVAGAIVGGLLGGGKGAAEGAAVGGAAGTGVVLATRGKEVRLGEGAAVRATLSKAVSIEVPR